MLGKRVRPMIGNLSEFLVSTHKSGFWDPLRSPKSPLEYLKSPSSPRGLMKRYDVGGVGLGIIASMEKSTSDSCKNAICSSNLSRSTAIVVNYGKNYDGFKGRFEGLEMENLEDYTYVTSHDGHGKTSTKVYFNGGEEQRSNVLGHDRNGFLGTVKETSSSSSSTTTARFVEDVKYPTSDFLSSCHLCNKKLHGKDIYMYRGEKAFCSTECRSSQIMIDERKERCKSKALRSEKNSSSGYDNSGQIFSAGILAI